MPYLKFLRDNAESLEQQAQQTADGPILQTNPQLLTPSTLFLCIFFLFAVVATADFTGWLWHKFVKPSSVALPIGNKNVPLYHNKKSHSGDRAYPGVFEDDLDDRC
ncbi:hypothetical protein FQN57_001789 [Myotisia sp. PD_48]|nr:hypothetical protein FQN57_001789 [Myotisia sp. PD_48]